MLADSFFNGEKMNNIRIGIIGSGGMASRHAQSFSHTDGFELTAIAARNIETGPALASKYAVDYLPTYRDMLKRDDIDAIANMHLQRHPQ